MHSGFVWWYYKIVYCLTSVENYVFPLSAEGTTRVNWVWYSRKIEIQFSAYAPFYIFRDKCVEKQHVDKFKTSLKVINFSGAIKNYKLWKIHSYFLLSCNVSRKFSIFHAHFCTLQKWFSTLFRVWKCIIFSVCLIKAFLFLLIAHTRKINLYCCVIDAIEAIHYFVLQSSTLSAP